MSIPASLPDAVLELFAGFLLPLILPYVADDRPAAKSLALHLLAAMQPHGPRELSLATEIVADGLKSLAMLARSAEPELSVVEIDDALKWACGLSRAGHGAQRLLDELQRVRRAAERRQGLAAASDAAASVPLLPGASDGPPWEPVTAAEDAAPPNPDGEDASATDSSVTDAPSAAGSLPQDAPDPAVDVAKAETALASAERLLALMQQHVKGGVPPHSQAARQIREQRRIVDAARLRLRQVRRLHAAPAA